MFTLSLSKGKLFDFRSARVGKFEKPRHFVECLAHGVIARLSELFPVCQVFHEEKDGVPTADQQ